MRYYRAETAAVASRGAVAAGAGRGLREVNTNSARTGGELSGPGYMDLNRELVTPPVSHQHQAGFVTPQVASSFSQQQQQQAARWPGPPVVPSRMAPLVNSPRPPPPQGHRRGGRRPKDDEHLSPEEEERRRQRRERNKQAAARCRRRRMDLTHSLEMETEELEGERSNLEQEIQLLQAQKDELNFLLQAHRGCCRLRGDKENQQRVQVKPEPPPAAAAAAAAAEEPRLSAIKQEPGHSRHPRPTTLSVAPGPTGSARKLLASVPISTPSAGIGLNFDSLMDGGTGLTPVSGAGPVPLVPVSTSTLPTGSLSTPVTNEPSRRPSDPTQSPDSGPKHLVSL